MVVLKITHIKVSKLLYYETMNIPTAFNFGIDDTKHHSLHPLATRTSNSLIIDVTFGVWYHQFQNHGWLALLQFYLIFNVENI